MRIDKDTQRIGKTVSAFRTPHAEQVQPLGATDPDERDLERQMLQTMRARLIILEDELEKRRQARANAQPKTAPWIPEVVEEQDTENPNSYPRRKQAIQTYQKTAHIHE